MAISTSLQRCPSSVKSKARWVHWARAARLLGDRAGSLVLGGCAWESQGTRSCFHTFLIPKSTASVDWRSAKRLWVFEQGLVRMDGSGGGYREQK